MRKVKIKIIILSSILLILAAFLVYLLPVRPLISQQSNISEICVYTNEYDSTSQRYSSIPVPVSNQSAIENIIKSICCNRLDTGKGTYLESDVQYKIFFICNCKSYDVLLGTENTIYVPALIFGIRPCYTVTNADEIIAELEVLLAEN